MKKYIQNPVEVQAFQWKGGLEEFHRLAEVLDGEQHGLHTIKTMNLEIKVLGENDDVLQLIAANGSFLAHKGDWIVVSADHDASVVSSGVFANLYTPAVPRDDMPVKLHKRVLLDEVCMDNCIGPVFAKEYLRKISPLVRRQNRDLKCSGERIAVVMKESDHQDEGETVYDLCLQLYSLTGQSERSALLYMAEMFNLYWLEIFSRQEELLALIRGDDVNIAMHQSKLAAYVPA